MEDSVQLFFKVSIKNHIKAYFRIYSCQNLSLSMFLRCSYFFAKSEADVLINSVLIKRKACMCTQLKSIHHVSLWPVRLSKSWRSLGVVIAERGSAYSVVAAYICCCFVPFSLLCCFFFGTKLTVWMLDGIGSRKI